MKGVTIIPFRRGSSFADKNFREVGGMTLVERTMRFAIDTIPFPVVLYTDYDQEEMEGFGLQLWTPTVLPDLNAGKEGRDITTVLADAALELREQGAGFDTVCWLSPNQLVRKQAWARHLLDQYETGGYASAFVLEPTYKQVWKMNPRMQRVTSGHHGNRQEKVPEAYIEHTGTMLLVDADRLMNGERTPPPCYTFMVDHPWVGLDIHTAEDLALATRLHEMGAL